jgi:PAS domain S-box-containing protein
MISEQEKNFVTRQYSMVNNVPMGMLIMRNDHTVLTWNATMAKWTCIDEETIVGRNIVDFFPRFSKSTVKARLDKVFRGKGPILFSPDRHPDLIMAGLPKERARILKIHASAVPSFQENNHYALLTIEDITALSIRMADFKTMSHKALEEVTIRTDVEEKLKQQNLILQGILSASPTAIILVENRIVKWGNEAAGRLFGYEREEEYIGKNVRMFYASNAWYKSVAETLVYSVPRKLLIEADAEFIKKNGEVFTGHMKVSCINPEKPLDQNIVTISDLSSRIKAEQDRISGEKLLSVLEMAGAVCHELNQPLMAISGYSELLMMGLDPSHPHYDKLSKIHAQIKKTGEITRKLMSITKYETRKYTDRVRIFDLKTIRTPDI